MEQRKVYNLKATLLNVINSNFKLKSVENLINLIGKGRLNNQVKFSKYGLITYDENDTKNKFPIVTELDAFNRNKTNCIIYDITDKDVKKYYNKMFIYKTIVKETVYGFYLLNTETGDCSHSYELGGEFDDELIVDITKSFNTIKKMNVWKFYSDKSDFIHNLGKNKVGRDKSFWEFKHINLDDDEEDVA